MWWGKEEARGTGEDDSLVATGEMVCFFIRADDGRPAPLPEWLTPVLRCLTPENG